MNKKIFPSYIKNTAWLSAGVIFFIIDRLLKLLAISPTINHTQKLIGNIFTFNFIPNYNIAFSLPLNGLWLNIAISLIIIVLFYYFLTAKDLEKTALFLIISGALSNIIDRWYYGYVIDYLDLKWFTIFNIADALICFGTIILIIVLFKKPRI